MSRVQTFLTIAAISLLMGCAANPPEEMGGAVAVPAAVEATAVPALTINPTVQAPNAPTAVPTSQPTAVPTATPPTFSNPRDEAMAETAVAHGAEFNQITLANSGFWTFAAGSFPHPIALDVWQETAFLLDGGRVLTINLDQPAPPHPILTPGDMVGDLYVQEPLDLAVAGAGLLVLDRAGDVYRYDLAGGNWQVVRHDRPVRDTSGHYYVAVAAAGDDHFLLETNYKYALQASADEPDLLWPLPDVRAVDIGVAGEDAFVLAREMDSWQGHLLRYQNTRLIDFSATDLIVQPRELHVTATAVAILDQAGRRLLTFARDTGALETIIQLPAQNHISAFWLDKSGKRLILAGQDSLFFYQQPEMLAAISGGMALDDLSTHHPDFFSNPVDFITPIGGSGITRRDLQLPGAPRHYRLGIHQGIDFYWQPGTPVLAAADGVVVRAILDYVSPTQAQFYAWRSELQELGYTSDEALDVYRGRQVWVQHDNGLVTRYVHLSHITPGIAEGVTVTAGQLLGAVGNSGSPLSLESETADAHLHFEIWLGDHYLGQFLRPIETREWVETTFGQ